MQEAMLKQISSSYYRLLKRIDWDDPILLSGIREGLNKFLSNAYIAASGKNKYLTGDYYSEAALAKVKNGDQDGLVFEHLVPKRKYIQGPCERAAQGGTLSEEMIADLLTRYWRIAIVTREEDQKLLRTKMPDDWDFDDTLKRYSEAGIVLLEIEEGKAK